MAEALVISVLKKSTLPILKEIGPPIFQIFKTEANLVLGVQKQVENLATTLRSLQVFLRDADVKQVNDAGVKAWLEELKDIAYDADDVLEEWSTTILLSQLNPVTPSFTEKILYYLISLCSSQPNPPTSSITDQIRYYLFSPCSSHIPACCSCFIPDDLRQHHRIGIEIQAINERLDRFALDNTRYRLTEIPIHQSPPRRPTSSLVTVAEIYGRDKEKELIVDWLLVNVAESSNQEIRMPVPVFAIVGTPGFGKTSLAQLVFQLEKTKYELAIWVCVSQPFDLKKIAKEIIEQATGNKAPNFAGWEALHQKLSDSIEGKRFLIVMDDVWSKNPDDWTPIKDSLDGGAPGSRIIVTTRDEGVAKMMGSITYRLAELSEEDCWLLFKQIAFVGRSQKECDTLEEIGKEIAAKCKGVPLATKAVAGLMRHKQSKIDWRNVLENDIWKLQQGKDGFSPSLLLSYDDLPSNLKPCFLYCVIFPKDDIIKKDKLVKLWMAQDFLRSNGEKELENTGEGYFNELAMRSFFQDFKEDGEGKIIECKMHDLVHDFAQFLTKTECSILENNDTLLYSEKLRHINADDIGIESLSSIKVKKLRSLMMGRSKPILSELFCQVTCLRSLDLNFSSLEKLPDEVERLLHLRYLDLSYTDLTELPETMCNLYNLQTLKLIGCCNLYKLPEGIGRLLNLRHVECEGTSYLSYFPQGFGKLKHLRTLPKFVVSNASGGCKLKELEDLNLISGELEIRGLYEVENIDEATQAKLQRKKNIVSLKLLFTGQMITLENENNMKKQMEGIIEGLQPNINLEQLEVGNYPGLAFPSWMSKMSNLVKLELYRCENCTQLPALGKLPFLESLEIKYFSSIKKVGVEFLGISESGIQRQKAFPKLRELKFYEMKEWEEWNLSLSPFHQNEILLSLSLLKIVDCPKLKALPATISKLPSFDRLEIRVMRGSADVFGICGFVNGESMPSSSSSSTSLVPLFPKLTSLELSYMGEWEGEIHETTASTISTMPSLRDLSIRWCKKLKVIPNYLFSHHLRKLTIRDCPKLIEMQPCNLSSLESLDIEMDVGAFSRSLMHITGSKNNHNLKFFRLRLSPHSSLPQGLNHFKSLQQLKIIMCHSIDFNPEEELSSEHFPNLRKLKIRACDLMTERCSRVNWSNLSHISEIYVDDTQIRG